MNSKSGRQSRSHGRIFQEESWMRQIEFISLFLYGFTMCCFYPIPTTFCTGENLCRSEDVWAKISPKLLNISSWNLAQIKFRISYKGNHRLSLKKHEANWGRRLKKFTTNKQSDFFLDVFRINRNERYCKNNFLFLSHMATIFFLFLAAHYICKVVVSLKFSLSKVQCVRKYHCYGNFLRNELQQWWYN